MFEVADTDEAVAGPETHGGKSDDPTDMLYGRIASMSGPVRDGVLGHHAGERVKPTRG